MSYYWIKLYHEIIDDPKMATLPDNLWRRVIELFLLAGRHNQDGQLPCTKSIAWELRMSQDDVEIELAELERVGIISRNDTGWFVNQFATRQAAQTSTERSNNFREKVKHEKYTDDERQCGIYKIECVPAGMVYIGSSVDIEHRINVHFHDGKTFKDHWMYDDLKSYGRGGFTVSTLEITTEDKLPEAETRWIQKYKPNIYNTETKGKPHRDRNATQLQRNVAQITDIESDTDKKRVEAEPRDAFDDMKELVETIVGRPSTPTRDIQPIKDMVKNGITESDLREAMTFLSGKKKVYGAADLAPSAQVAHSRRVQGKHKPPNPDDANFRASYADGIPAQDPDWMTEQDVEMNQSSQTDQN
jgi:group I intron endonuclease